MAALSDGIRPKPRAGGALELVLAAMGLVSIAVGAALCHMPMLGLLFYAVTFAGGCMLALGLAMMRGERSTGSLAGAAGAVLELVGAFAAAASALCSTGLAWRRLMAIERPAATVYQVHGGDVALAGLGWLVAPSLIALGLYLRTRRSRMSLAGWWLLAFSSQPAAVICFQFSASQGVAFSA